MSFLNLLGNQQQQPDVLQSLFGKGGALGNPLAKAAVAGIAAMAAKQFLSGQGTL
jgi:hypothetical protein